MTSKAKATEAPVDIRPLRERGAAAWAKYQAEEARADRERVVQRLENRKHMLAAYLKAAFGVDIAPMLSKLAAAEYEIEGLLFTVAEETRGRNLLVGVSCPEPGCGMLLGQTDLYPDPEHAAKSLGHWLAVQLPEQTTVHQAYHARMATAPPGPVEPVLENPIGCRLPQGCGLSPAERAIVVALREYHDEQAQHYQPRESER